MTRFNAKIGGGVLVGLGLLYLALALWAGHSATAQPPPDLSAQEAGLDVWRALALVARGGGEVVDVRPAAAYRVYHLPRSSSVPHGGSREVHRAAARGTVLVVASSDADAARIAGELRARHRRRAHFLRGGARAWYLALELPVPLFADKPPPHGYGRALSLVRAWLEGESGGDAAAVRRAIGILAATAYEPTQLGTKARPKSSGKKKKISGGCG